MQNDSPIIELGLHMPITELIENSPIKFSKECMPDFDLCWYKITKSANSANLPGAIIRNEAEPLTLSHVTSVTTMIDHRIGPNVENLTLTLRGLPDNSTHRQNIEFISSLFENIKACGWQRYYFADDPRINGSQASKIHKGHEVFGRYVSNHPWLDLDYPIDTKRWLQSSMYEWYFYSNGNYLKLMAWRINSTDNPTDTGTYLITVNIRSEREFWLSGFTNSIDKSTWKELLNERMRLDAATRRTLEDKARAAGIEIDETYEDPPINVFN